MKYLNRKYLRIPLISLILSLALLFILFILAVKGINIQLGIPPNGIGHRGLSILLIIISVISLVYMVKDIVIRVVIIGVGALFIFMLSFQGLLSGTEYTSFTSPDNQEVFIVVERNLNKLYKLSDSRLFMTYITDIPANNQYKPFANGGYKLEWKTSPKELIIHYAFNRKHENNIDKYNEITIQIK